MTKNYFIIGLALTGLMLLGGGCSQSDTSLVIDFFNSWAQTRGITDKNGNPTASSIWYVATGQTTGNDQTDAAIDAGQVIKSIKDADAKVAKADVALAKKPPDNVTAMANIDSALTGRPKDQTIRTRKGVLLLETGQGSKAAAPYLAINSAKCSGAIEAMTQGQVERCYDQIQAEVNEMASANIRAYDAKSKPRCAVLTAQRAGRQQMYYLSKRMNFLDPQDDPMFAYGYLGGGQMDCMP